MNKHASGLLHQRLRSATRAELDRVCLHLRISATSEIEDIEGAYVGAADNSIFTAVRPLISINAPTYSQVLLLIYKKLRPFSEDLDETWHRVKSLKFWGYKPPLGDMDDLTLERLILDIYKAEYDDSKEKVESDPGFLDRVQNRFPESWKDILAYSSGITGAMASGAATVSAHTAIRLPFGAAAPGVAAGPVGLALAVVFIGSQLAGPAYRKIVPATVEIMLIGRRITHMPKD